MLSFQSLKAELQQINHETTTFLERVLDLPGMPVETFQAWQEICETIQRQVSVDVIRVAVVGAIKSGKSTFVNSLFKEDYLKRGAGVVTSIVTRVYNGSSLKATLYFKSWEEVNRDMEQALDLLPHQIMCSLGLGLTAMASGAKMIWDCLTCYQCQENCPQQVEVCDLLYELKNVAAQNVNIR